MGPHRLTLLLGILVLWGCTYEDAPDGRTGLDSQSFRYTHAQPASGATGVARNSALLLRFSHPPDGDSVTGGRVRLFTGRYEILGSTRVDLLEQAITFTPGASLRPNLQHLLRVSKEVRAINGTPLAQNLLLDFTTGLQERAATQPEPPVPTGAQVLTTLKASCGGCHVGANAPLGVRLGTMTDIQQTLVGRPASVGNRALIRTGEHARSYLMLKLLDQGAISGFPMPPSGPKLPTATLRLIARWIDAGARP